MARYARFSENHTRHRRSKKWPLVLFLMIAVGAILSTVLLANGGRNLRAVFGMPRMEAAPAPSSTPFEQQEKIRPPSPRWPWLSHTAELQPLRKVGAPRQMCGQLALNGHEEPEFQISAARIWKCSVLRPENSSSSLFLQARGRENSAATSIRVKFNLGSDGLSDGMTAEALTFFYNATVLPPDRELRFILQKKLETRRDFYLLAGYYSLTFHREIDARDRYNLIGVDRIADTFGQRPHPWTITPFATRKPAGGKAPKGPRLSASSAGND